MTAQEDYLGRVRAAAWQVADRVQPCVRLDQAMSLIEHGEPADGLVYLAWAIVESRTQVPAELIQFIRDGSGDLVDPADYPPDLDDFAEPE